MSDKRSAREKELLAAALKVFAEKGYHGAQISDIIKAAGVARGTFYLYFEGKREIFARLLDHIFSEVRRVVENLPRGREASPQIPTKMYLNLRRVADLFAERPDYARVLLCESVSLDPESDERLRHFYGQLLALLESALRQGQEMGFVREGDVSLLAVFVLGMIKELFYQRLLGTLAFESENAVQGLYRSIAAAVARPQWLEVIETLGTAE